MGKPILIADRRRAVWLGLALTLAGAVVLWDAYESRGRPRPLAVRLAGVL